MPFFLNMVDNMDGCNDEIANATMDKPSGFHIATTNSTSYLFTHYELK